MHDSITSMSRYLWISILAFGLGCGASQADGEGGCDDDQDCWTQLGDPPADASWRCVDHQCSAQGAGPFEAEPVAAEPEPADDGPSAPPTVNQPDVRCTTAGDCAVLGAPPADASWVCTEGHCGLRGAGPFHAEDTAPDPED